MGDEPDPHDVLGVAVGATVDEVRAAYRRLAREKHPDVGGSAEEFAAVERAYRTLVGRAPRRLPRSARRRRDEWELAQGLRVEAYRWAKRGRHHPDPAVARAAYEWACDELEPRPVTGLRVPKFIRWFAPPLAGDNMARQASRRRMARVIHAVGEPPA